MNQIIDEKGFEERGGYDVGCDIVQNVADLISPQVIHDVKNGGATLPITVLGFKSMCLTLLTGLSMSLEREKDVGCGTVQNARKVFEVLLENYDVMHARFMKIITLIKVEFFMKADSIDN